jgi:hypothetical protein
MGYCSNVYVLLKKNCFEAEYKASTFEPVIDKEGKPQLSVCKVFDLNKDVLLYFEYIKWESDYWEKIREYCLKNGEVLQIGEDNEIYRDTPPYHNNEYYRLEPNITLNLDGKPFNVNGEKNV